MIMAISAREKGLDSQVDQRFGRCAFFVLVNVESGELVKSIENTNAASAGGAGPQSVQILSEHGVNAVALGNVGPNAVTALKAAGMEIYTGIEGTVQETLKKFKEGKLEVVPGATVSSHFGAGRGRNFK